MLRAIGLLGGAGVAVYLVANGGQLAGIDLASAPTALVLFAGASAAILVTLRYI
jgi:hypothetical protein